MREAREPNAVSALLDMLFIILLAYRVIFILFYSLIYHFIAAYLVIIVLYYHEM